MSSELGTDAREDSSGAPAECSGLSGATKNAGLELNGQKRKGGN